ncbi:MAG: hypothetical protein KDH97_13760 [Calditrichaeota bacterium]|nr:hypothetical protein [Calditrichota bacterium]MCB0291314.1 hypothetical protein [Calditrichota bacterium]
MIQEHNYRCHCEALFAEAISCVVHPFAVTLEAIRGRLPHRKIGGSQ